MNVQTESVFQKPLGNFYNTLKLSEEKLKKAKAGTCEQNVKILTFFIQHPDTRFTPFDIEDRFNAWPITSVRRALTDLTESNFLIKSDCPEKMGREGRPNHTWRLNPKKNVRRKRK